VRLEPGIALAGHQVAGCCSATVDVGTVPGAQLGATGDRSTGTPDVLVNNAGITTAPILSGRRIRGTFGAAGGQCPGTYHVIRAFLPFMVERRRGVVVNFSSDWGRSTDPWLRLIALPNGPSRDDSRPGPGTPTGMAAVSLDPGTVNTDMLRFTSRRRPGYPEPDRWCIQAADLLLSLGAGTTARPSLCQLRNSASAPHPVQPSFEFFQL